MKTSDVGLQSPQKPGRLVSGKDQITPGPTSRTTSGGGFKSRSKVKGCFKPAFHRSMTPVFPVNQLQHRCTLTLPITLHMNTHTHHDLILVAVATEALETEEEKEVKDGVLPHFIVLLLLSQDTCTHSPGFLLPSSCSSDCFSAER